MTTISVIIPTYNRSSTIRNCIQSVINQTYPVSEIIIVDDNSNDNTIEIVNSIRDGRIKIIKHETNKGAQAARNSGIKAATSDWIAFLDSDDEWLPEKIEYQVKTIKEFNYSPFIMVHTNCFVQDHKNNERYEYPHPIVEGANIYTTLLQYPGPSFPSILTSKKALEEIGYLDEDILSHQEWETSIRLSNICRIIHIKIPLFIWHLVDSNAISRNGKNHILGYEQIINKHKQDILEIKNGCAWDQHVINLIRKCLENGFYDKADHYLENRKGLINKELFELKLYRRLNLFPNRKGFIYLLISKIAWIKTIFTKLIKNRHGIGEAIKWRLYKRMDKYLLKQKTLIKSKTICIIRLDAIGDYILFRNFIEIIKDSKKFKDYSIVLIGNDIWKDIALNFDSEYVDCFFWINTNKLQQNRWYRFKTLYKLGKNGYEYALYPVYSRNYLLGDEIAKFIKAKNKVTSSGEAGIIPESLKDEHDKYYNILIDALSQPTFEFIQNKHFFESFLEEKLDIIKPLFNISNSSRTNIILFIGAGHPLRKWAVQNFIDLIQKLVQLTEQSIFLCGGTKEIEDAITIMKHFSDNKKVFNYVGEYTLSEFVKEIAKAELLISNESNAIHIAASTNTKAICISNGNHFGRFTPYPEKLANQISTIYPPLIQKQIENGNVEKIARTYNKGSVLDINEINVEQVIKIAKLKLNTVHEKSY